MPEKIKDMNLSVLFVPAFSFKGFCKRTSHATAFIQDKM